MPEFVMMIGTPGSGKSTYTNKINTPDKNYVILKRSTLVRQLAEERGVLIEEIKRSKGSIDFHQLLLDDIAKAVSEKRNIILDRANLRPEIRQDFLDTLTSDYKKIAVIFKLPDHVIEDRLNQRFEETGKVTPVHVVEKSRNSYIPPDITKFDEIIEIDEDGVID